MAQEKRSIFAGILLLGSAVIAGIANFGRDFLTGVGAQLVADEIRERADGSVQDVLGSALSGSVLWIGVSIGLIIAFIIVVNLLLIVINMLLKK